MFFFFGVKLNNIHFFGVPSLKLTASSPLKKSYRLSKGKAANVFQSSIFRDELLAVRFGEFFRTVKKNMLRKLGMLGKLGMLCGMLCVFINTVDG